MAERSNLGERNKFFMVFQDESGSGNIFSPQGLKDICTAEAIIVESNEFSGGRGVEYPYGSLDFDAEAEAYSDPGVEYPGMCALKNAGGNSSRRESEQLNVKS